MSAFTRLNLLALLCCCALSLAGCRAGAARPVSSVDGVGPDARQAGLELEEGLTLAAKRGEVAEVRRLLALGADPDGLAGAGGRGARLDLDGPREAYLDGHPITPLVAVLTGNRFEAVPQADKFIPWEEEPEAVDEIVRVLLAAGADPDIQTWSGSTALMEAVEVGALAIARLLLRAGADANLSRTGYTQIDIHRSDPATALAAAVRSDRPGIIADLLEAGADPFDRGWGPNAFERAAGNSDMSSLRILLAHVDREQGLDAPALGRVLSAMVAAWPEDYWVRPEDMLRAKADWFDVFRALVERGATFALVDKKDRPYGVEDIDLPMFRDWLSNGRRQGLDPPVVQRPAMEALFGDEDPSRLIAALDAGLDPNTKYYDFGLDPVSPVMDVFLSYEGEAALVRLKALVQAGFDLDQRDGIGYTLLHLAVQDEGEAVVRYLVEQGADVNAVISNGQTPLDHAWAEDEQVSERVKKLLRDHGAERGVKNNVKEAVYPRAKQADATLEPRLEALMDRARQREAFESLVGDRRYLREVDDQRQYRAGRFKIGRVIKYEMPVGPAFFIVFDAEKDAQGRSAFICFRGDGAMLPRAAGEAWRLRPEDVVDLDHDGAVELLIGITLRDNRMKLGGLRVVSTATAREQPEDWVVLHPHREEPGAMGWRVTDELWDETRRVELGPLGREGALLWSAWALTYEERMLEKQASEVTWVDNDPYSARPWVLVKVGPDSRLLRDAADVLAERLDPGWYE